MITIEVPFTANDNTIAAPSYAHDGDAGIDLRSTIDYVIQPFERALIPTGLSFAIPEGYAGLVIPRSGLAINHGISIVNAPGLIDSGYRGEIKVILINMDSNKPFEIKTGDRIAQLVFTPYAHAQLKQQQSLDTTERGEKGFGSSGVS